MWTTLLINHWKSQQSVTGRGLHHGARDLSTRRMRQLEQGRVAWPHYFNKLTAISSPISKG